MVRAGSSPGDARSFTAPAQRPWLLPTASVALASLCALVFVPSDGRWAIAGCGLVATVMVAALSAEVVKRGRALAELRRERVADEEFLRRRLGTQEAQLLYLAEELLPQGVVRIQRGDFVDDIVKDSVAPEGTVTPEFQAASQAALRAVLEAVDAEEALRESAQRAFVNIARRVQAIVHRQAQDLRAMEDRHGEEPGVFDDLLRLDHGNALVGRLADSIAVLGGARPGRQWGRSVPLYSVLRGAMSRIMDYQRVELHPVSEVAVIGPAVEPLIHALAELLDNATRYSPPHTRVHLTAAEVQSGIAVEIEDGGLSLSEEGRARAERMLREAQAGIDLNDLGETPRLGLAVVGRLAQTNGFQVSLRPSAYGGVRAVLIVPQDLLTSTPSTGVAHGIGAVSGPRRAGDDGSQRGRHRSLPSERAGSLAPVASAPAPRAADTTRGADLAAVADMPDLSDEGGLLGGVKGLPQRRRRALRTDLADRRTPTTGAVDRQVTATDPAEEGADAGPSAPGREQAGVQPGLWLAAFQGAVSDPSAKAPGGARGAGQGAGSAREPGVHEGGGEDHAGARERGSD
ncbi:ATP-binding protein [Streptacidiphilus pinicola]|uniref:ATP-binding protein n=1 Tax=Streptacidiphilus pinicola TaxID=2219663 RepID=UPI001FB3F222|nr:ATP-binding protein [Streptacidiphilus pinicola]